jgi:Flp pilus assembly protein TadB
MTLALCFLSASLACLVYWIARGLPLPPEAPAPRRSTFLTSLELRVERQLAQAGVPVTGRQFLSVSLWAAGAGALLGYPFHNQPLLLMMAGALGLAPYQALQFLLLRRSRAIHGAVEPALVQISRSLAVKSEPIAALHLAAPALPPLLRPEFERALAEAEGGLPLPDALRSLAARCAHDFYLHQLAELVALHLRDGGDLSSTLTLLLERFRSMAELRAAEAAALSGWRWAIRVLAVAALLPLPYWAFASGSALQVYVEAPAARLALAVVMAVGLAAAALPYWLMPDRGEGDQ